MVAINAPDPNNSNLRMPAPDSALADTRLAPPAAPTLFAGALRVPELLEICLYNGKLRIFGYAKHYNGLGNKGSVYE